MSFLSLAMVDVLNRMITTYQSGRVGLSLPPFVAYGGRTSNAIQQSAHHPVEVDGPGRDRAAVCEPMIVSWLLGFLVRRAKAVRYIAVTGMGAVRLIQRAMTMIP